MILGIGIDSVEIARFERWKSFNQKQLERIFSPDEITYCFAQPNKTAERLAARYAAREAFYKALTATNPALHLPFLTLCSRVRVSLERGHPELVVGPALLARGGLTLKTRIHLTLTHTATTATAFLIIEEAHLPLELSFDKSPKDRNL